MSASMQAPDGETDAEWQEHIIAAAKIAKFKGNCPGVARDFLAKLQAPSRNWKDIVRARISKVYRGRYTLRKPGRRSFASPMFMASRLPKPEPPIIALDCSGSIGHPQICQFLGEIMGIMQAVGAPDVYIYFHDVRVYDEGVFDKNTITKIKVTDGGTSHMDLWNKIEERKDKPGMIICMTDLESDQMGLKDLGIPVLWCHPTGDGHNNIPFGKKVEVHSAGY